MKELIEDYKRRLASVKEMLDNFKSTGSHNDIQKEERLKIKAGEYRTIIAELERFGAPEFIKKIDFTDLRTQKTVLVNISSELQKNEDIRFEDLDGIINLIDALQNYAVDELGWPEMQVFDLDVELEDTENKPRKVWCCAKCGGDHVEEKRWVDLNTGEVNESDDTNHFWCTDCEESVDVYQTDIKAGAKVIGFQVVADPNGNEGEGDFHPQINHGNDVFSLSQARNLFKNNHTSSDWQLLAIWTGDIENPVFKFEGDPRD